METFNKQAVFKLHCSISLKRPACFNFLRSQLYRVLTKYQRLVRTIVEDSRTFNQNMLQILIPGFHPNIHIKLLSR